MVAQGLSENGAAVGLLARTAGELAETLELIESAGGAAVAVRADVTDERAAAAAVAHVRGELGPIDLLVNNAGILGPVGPTWSVDGDEWWRTMEVNLRGLLTCTQLVVPEMVSRRRGRIINMTSQAGVFRWPLVSAYSVSKAAVAKLTENLARETSRYGVTVFSVHPGLLPIGMAELASASRAEPDSPEGRIWTWVEGEFREGRGASPGAALELILNVAAGKADALTGRHLSVHDDLEAVLAEIDEVRERDLYVLHPQRLAPPPVRAAS
jgi:NAD(P)-dependent dehydrogenase (short-subunit alcohol dehydrogenase family)